MRFMEFSSADFMKLTLQEVADMLLDQDRKGVMCRGMVDGQLYTLFVKLELFVDGK